MKLSTRLPEWLSGVRGEAKLVEVDLLAVKVFTMTIARAVWLLNWLAASACLFGDGKLAQEYVVLYALMFCHCKIVEYSLTVSLLVCGLMLEETGVAPQSVYLF